jgi:hypothetical protein
VAVFEVVQQLGNDVFHLTVSSVGHGVQDDVDADRIAVR